MNIRQLFSTVALLAVMALFGCGGGGGSDGGGSDTQTPPDPSPPAAKGITISGVAAVGLISDADVKAYDIKDGKVDTNAVLGIGKTGTDGTFVITLFPVPTGPIVVEVSGGTFTDVASGTPNVNLKTKLHTAVSSVHDGSEVSVTPITHLAYMQVVGLGAFSPTEIDDANLQIGRFFEVSNIVESYPFDPTQPAPAGASNDQRIYAAALAVFSHLVNDSKGDLSLEDAVGAELSKLETELEQNGGFSIATINATNTAISNYAKSGKNLGGLPLRPVAFSGGVLQLSTEGTLPADTLINGIDFSVTLPDGVTVKMDPATGDAQPGVVVPVSLAANNSLVSVKVDRATGVVRILLINVKPGFAIGEFAHLEFNGFPAIGSDFVLKVNRIDGSSIPSGPLTGITVTAAFAGL